MTVDEVVVEYKRGEWNFPSTSISVVAYVVVISSPALSEEEQEIICQSKLGLLLPPNLLAVLVCCCCPDEEGATLTPFASPKNNMGKLAELLLWKKELYTQHGPRNPINS